MRRDRRRARADHAGRAAPTGTAGGHLRASGRGWRRCRCRGCPARRPPPGRRRGPAAARSRRRRPGRPRRRRRGCSCDRPRAPTRARRASWPSRWSTTNLRVVTCTVDEAGVASVLEALADDVDARSRGDAAVLPDRAVRPGDRQLAARGAAGGSRRRPATVPMPVGARGRAGSADRRDAHRRGQTPGHTSAARPCSLDVTRRRESRKRAHAAARRPPCVTARSSAKVRRGARSCPAKRPASTGRRGPGAAPRSRSAAQLGGVVAPDQLQGRLAARRNRVARPRRWCGRAGRCAPATRRCPCRGSARGIRVCRPTASTTSRPARLSSSAICTPDDEAPTTSTPPAGSERRVAVVGRGERRRPAARPDGHVRGAVAARSGDDDCPGPPGPAVRRDGVAGRRRPETRTCSTVVPVSDRRAERGGVRLEVAHERAGRQEAVRVRALVAPAGQPRHPVRRQQVQGVPALGAPALADPAAVEDDVVATGGGEQAAHGQAGVAGADDDGVGLPGAPRRSAGCGACPAGSCEGCRRQRVTTSMTTGVGLVRTS